MFLFLRKPENPVEVEMKELLSYAILHEAKKDAEEAVVLPPDAIGPVGKKEAEETLTLLHALRSLLETGWFQSLKCTSAERYTLINFFNVFLNVIIVELICLLILT